MAIYLQRGNRDTDHAIKRTPNHVGPGVYNPMKGVPDDRENMVPFNTIKERQPLSSNENPGPGDYAQDKVKVVATVKDMMSNSFTTKVSLTGRPHRRRKLTPFLSLTVDP